MEANLLFTVTLKSQLGPKRENFLIYAAEEKVLGASKTRILLTPGKKLKHLAWLVSDDDGDGDAFSGGFFLQAQVRPLLSSNLIRDTSEFHVTDQMVSFLAIT